jgi:starvation-inducible DNA-binding protein
MKIDIGIKEGDRAEIAQGLSRLLADTYTCTSKPTTFTGTSPARCSKRFT